MNMRSASVQSVVEAVLVVGHDQRKMIDCCGRFYTKKVNRGCITRGGLSDGVSHCDTDSQALGEVG